MVYKFYEKEPKLNFLTRRGFVLARKLLFLAMLCFLLASLFFVLLSKHKTWQIVATTTGFRANDIEEKKTNRRFSYYLEISDGIFIGFGLNSVLHPEAKITIKELPAGAGQKWQLNDYKIQIIDPNKFIIIPEDKIENFISPGAAVSLQIQQSIPIFDYLFKSS